jgi:hypothetical protein
MTPVQSAPAAAHEAPGKRPMFTLLAKAASQALPWRGRPRSSETSKVSTVSDTETMMDSPYL